MKIRGGEGTPGNDSRDWNTLIVTRLKACPVEKRERGPDFTPTEVGGQSGSRLAPVQSWIPASAGMTDTLLWARDFHCLLCHFRHGSSRDFNPPNDKSTPRVTEEFLLNHIRQNCI